MADSDHQSKEDDKEEEESQKELSLDHLYTQIKSVPDLLKKAVFVEQALSSHFEEIQSAALSIMRQFDQRKEKILKRFDRWLLPVAKEALDEMTQEAERLRQDLEEAFQDLDKTVKTDWIDHAKRWAGLYAKLHDNKNLREQVLKLVSDKTTQLIDKDIKVVNDYQNQSLAQLSQETEEFKDIEFRLKKATEDSLEALHNLKQSPVDLSLKQAADWMAHIHKQRETHFDHVLLKIDAIMKDVVQIEDERFDPIHFIEIENEIVFMEMELKHINESISKLSVKRSSRQDAELIIFSLEGLKEHLEQFDLSYAPNEVKAKVGRIQQAIQGMIVRLQDFFN